MKPASDGLKAVLKHGENERLAKNLTDLWNRPEHSRTFTVNAPCKLTEYATGRFHKKSFIGEEELRPFEAYVGKRGDIIFKLREVDNPSTVQHIEMSVGDAVNHLDGFTMYYTQLTSQLDDILTAETREVARAKEEAADREARRTADPLFGSW